MLTRFDNDISNGDSEPGSQHQWNVVKIVTNECHFIIADARASGKT